MSSEISAMDRCTGSFLTPGVAPEAEEQAQHADHQAGEQDLVPGEAEEVALVEVGQPEVHLAARPVLGTAAPGHFLGRQRRHRPPARARPRAAG